MTFTTLFYFSNKGCEHGFINFKTVTIMVRKKQKRGYVADNGAFIIKDNLIGWLVYRCKAAFEKGCQDYRSFEKLTDAKQFGLERIEQLAPFEG